MLSVRSPLDDETENLVHCVIGHLIAVHRELGPGLLEEIYRRAIRLELSAANIAFETEKSYPVRYRGEHLYEQRVDFVIGRRLLVEIKSVERLAPIHVAQVISYLRVSGLRIGLLLNFNVPYLPQGLRRVVV